MGARGKREAFSKRLWKTPLHVCTCSQPFPKRLSRPEFPAFSTIAAASIGHALQHKSDPPKRQENRKGNGVGVESTCSAIGEGRFGIELDDSAGSHRLRHDAGLFGLATHDANRRVARFHVAGNPGGLGHLQPRDEDDVNRVALALDLDGDGALAADDFRVAIR